MNRLEIILSALLLLSLIFNGGLFLYSRNVVARLLFISDELGDLQDMADSLAKHLKRVYELDSFYGDETLRHLLEHAISFNEHLLTFEEIYSLTERDNLDHQTTEDTIEEAEAENETALE